jgi:hypothetical protein
VDKLAAYQVILADHPLWTKEARVFGLSQPDVSEALEPYETRMARMEEYANAKAAEPKTHFGKAVGVGGLTGGAFGGALGLLAGANARSAALGAAVGGGFGALVGGSMAISDSEEIERMKGLQESGNFGQAAVDLGKRQLQERRDMEEAERHRMHYETMDRLDRLEGRLSGGTYGNRSGSPYRY